MVKRFKSPEGKQMIYESYDKLLELWGVDNFMELMEKLPSDV